MINLNKTPLADFLRYVENISAPEDFVKFQKLIQKELLEKAPVVAVVGKAGVGKTTTINNLFSVEEYVSEPITIDQRGAVGDVHRGTPTAIRKHYELKSGIGLDVIDFPGLGDDVRKDKVFEEIYRKFLPQCDIIIYILRADNKTLAEDERILQNIVLPCCDKKKLIVAINQVDLLGENEGLHWDTRINLPNEEQEVLIQEKQKAISKMFQMDLGIITEKTICYSALKHYNLFALLNAIVKTTPLGFIFPMTGELPDDFTVGIPDEYKPYVEIVKNL